jgi:hypothetical protein
MPKTDADRMPRPVSAQRKVPTYPTGRTASVIVVNSSGVAKVTPAYQQPADLGDMFSSMFGAGR